MDNVFTNIARPRRPRQISPRYTSEVVALRRHLQEQKTQIDHMRKCISKSEAIAATLRKQIAILETTNSELSEKVEYLQNECKALTSTLGQQLEYTNDLEQKPQQEIIKEIHHYHEPEQQSFVFEAITSDARASPLSVEIDIDTDLPKIQEAPEPPEDVPVIKPLPISTIRRRNSTCAVVRAASQAIERPSVRRRQSSTTTSHHGQFANSRTTRPTQKRQISRHQPSRQPRQPRPSVSRAAAPPRQRLVRNMDNASPLLKKKYSAATQARSTGHL